jgi:hypothetical protein
LMIGYNETEEMFGPITSQKSVIQNVKIYW